MSNSLISVTKCKEPARGSNKSKLVHLIRRIMFSKQKTTWRGRDKSVTYILFLFCEHKVT